MFKEVPQRETEEVGIRKELATAAAEICMTKRCPNCSAPANTES